MRGVLLLLLLTGCAHSAPSAQDNQSTEVRTIADLVEATRTTVEMSDRLEVEWKLADALERAGFLNLAFLYWTPLVKAQQHPHHDEAMAAFVRLQELRRDDFLIPAFFNQLASSGAALKLSEQDAPKVAWFRARIAFRKGQLQEAISLCAQVPSTSPVFERAEYLRASALSDLRLDSGAGTSEALPILERLAAQQRDNAVKAEATLALARLAYREKRWADSRRWYESATNLDSVRAEALVEQGWALIRLGDWKAASASVRRDEAQLSGLPDVQLIEALAVHFSGDQLGAESVLQRAPSADLADWNEATPARAFDALTTERGISAAELRRLKSNQRLMGLVSLVASFGSELGAVNKISEWKSNGVANEFAGYLTVNRDTLRIAAGDLALKDLRALQQEQAATLGRLALLGVEFALARKDLETAIKRQEALIAQPPVDGPMLSELRLRLAALQRAKTAVDRGVDKEKAIEEAMTSFERFLETTPIEQRLREAKEVLSPD